MVWVSLFIIAALKTMNLTPILIFYFILHKNTSHPSGFSCHWELNFDLIAFGMSLCIRAVIYYLYHFLCTSPLDIGSFIIISVSPLPMILFLTHCQLGLKCRLKMALGFSLFTGATLKSMDLRLILVVHFYFYPFPHPFQGVNWSVSIHLSNPDNYGFNCKSSSHPHPHSILSQIVGHLYQVYLKLLQVYQTYVGTW